MKKYNQNQIKFIVQQKISGVGWDQIARNFNKKFNLQTTSNSVRHVYRSVDLSRFKIPTQDKHKYDDFTKEAIGELIKNRKIKKGNFFITAASPTTHLDLNKRDLKKVLHGGHVTATNVDKLAFSSIRNFCKRNKAELIILPMPAHVKPLHSQPQHYDPILKPYLKKFATEYIFNDHLKAMDMHLNPQQRNPLAGLQSIAGKKSSYWKKYKTSILFAHSKQDMVVIPTGNDTHPRIIHATGCITLPNYLNNRIGKIADNEHKIGGLYVEIDGPVFHLTQIEIVSPDSSFCNLDKRYFPDGSIQKERAELIKFGDAHFDVPDEPNFHACEEMLKLFQPKIITFEDMISYRSVTHHEEKRRLTKAKVRTGYYGKWYQTLQGEMQQGKKAMYTLLKSAPKDAKIVMVACNHNDHLTRYLDEGRYINDPVNHEFAHRCVVQIYDGLDPMQHYIDPYNNFTWLGRNDDYYIMGVQVNCHSDLGANGARGAEVKLENLHGNAFGAHRHYPGIYKRMFYVGHISGKRHGYNEGASSWIPCNGIIYKYGQKQLRMIIDGKWRC